MNEPDPIDSLFEELCDLPKAERVAALGRCVDPEVRRRVRRLLELFDRPGPALDRGVRVRCRRERYEEAIGLLEEILAVRPDRPPEDAAVVARLELFLADLYLRLDRSEDALELTALAHRRALQVLGEHHPITSRLQAKLEAIERLVAAE